MRNGFIAIVSAFGILLSLASCSGNDNRDEKAWEFRPYQCEAVVKDSTTIDDDERPLRYVECHGVLPYYIEGQDITQLRDTLMSMGNIKESASGVSFRPTANMVLTQEVPDKTNFDLSQSSIWLSIKSASPDIIVWQRYFSSYSVGDAHGITGSEYLTYDILNRRILTFGNLFKKGYEPHLLTLIKNEIEQEGRTNEVDENITLPTQFYPTANGITFVYGVYEIAPYSSGEIAVPVSFMDLQPLLTNQSNELFGN